MMIGELKICERRGGTRLHRDGDAFDDMVGCDGFDDRVAQGCFEGEAGRAWAEARGGVGGDRDCV